MCLPFQDVIPVLDVTVAARLHAPDLGISRFEHSGGQVSGVIGVISAEGGVEPEAFDPSRHFAGVPGGGDDDVDPWLLEEGPCRDGVDGPLEKENS